MVNTIVPSSEQLQQYDSLDHWIHAFIYDVRERLPQHKTTLTEARLLAQQRSEDFKKESCLRRVT